MTFAGKIAKTAIKINKHQEQKFTELLYLKGENIFDTFLNVKSYNKLKKVKKEIRGVGKSLKREDKKALIKELNQEIDYALKTLPTRNEKTKAAKDYSQMLFDMKLTDKEKLGKNITFLDKLKSDNPKLRNIMKNSKTLGIVMLLGLYFNKNDIQGANEKLGSDAMAEEIGKTITRYSLGLGIIKQGVSLTKAVGTTASLYLPRGGKWANLGVILASLYACKGLNKLFDKLWQTDYEKYKTSA